MKKFVVLVLVLGMASLASATLTFDISDLQSIDVIGDGVTPGQGVYIMFDGDLVMDASTAVTLPGLYNVTFDYSDVVYGLPGWGVAVSGDAELFADLLVPGNPVPATELNRVVISGLKHVSGAGNMMLMSEDSYFGGQEVDLASVFIPEPATMVLLGLGGLLLRRKK